VAALPLVEEASGADGRAEIPARSRDHAEQPHQTLHSPRLPKHAGRAARWLKGVVQHVEQFRPELGREQLVPQARPGYFAIDNEFPPIPK
jgi:hypothetical protein